MPDGNTNSWSTNDDWNINSSRSIWVDMNKLRINEKNNDGQKEKKIKCSHCKKKISIGSIALVDGKKYCTSCKKELFFFCNNCETLKKKPAKFEFSNDKWEGKVCGECISSTGIGECIGCGIKLPKKPKYLIEIHGNVYCRHCVEMKFIRCQHCGEYILKGNEEIIGGGPFCRNCYDRLTAIRPYSYQPKYKRRKLKFEKNPLYLGIELEIEPPDHKWEMRRVETAKKLKVYLNSRIKGFFYLKKDSTIRGYEIVTHPFTLNFSHKKIPWKKILKKISNWGFTFYDNGRCGLHIHLSKRYFTKIELMKLRTFFSVNKRPLYKFSKRNGKYDRYCKYENYDLDKFLKTHKRNGHHWAINVSTNKNTSELRVFRGTLKYDRFLASLQFSDAVANFVKIVGVTHTTKQVSWSTFIQWCEKHQRYGHFLKYWYSIKNEPLNTRIKPEEELMEEEAEEAEEERSSMGIEESFRIRPGTETI